MRRAVFLALAMLWTISAGAKEEDLLGEQTWRKKGVCVARMRAATVEIGRRVPRLAGKLSVQAGPEVVELESQLGGTKAMVYGDWIDSLRPFAEHPRASTGPWKDEEERGPFRFSQRRNALEQGGWVAFSDKLTDDEGAVFVEIAQRAIDKCLTTLDPVVRVLRWVPNDGTILRCF
jgi:hypothetical protein